MSSNLKGQIWLSAEGSGGNFAVEQVRLLEAIDQTGSISAAAKQIGISYKTAWERLERMNNLSRESLVNRAAGGNQGGGSQLTAHGRKILEGYAKLSSEHHEFVANLGSGLNRIDDLASFVSTNRLLSSAGNQFLGTVIAVAPGAVNAEVTVRVNERVALVAIITEQSRIDLGIESGKQVIALVKASSILLTTSAELAVSARNIIRGSVVRLHTGKVNTDITLDIGDGKTLNAVITNLSSDRMKLKKGIDITAFFKASSVILVGN